MTDDLISRERALKALRDANIQVKGMRAGKTILVEYANQVRDGYIDVIRKMPASNTDNTESLPKIHGKWLYVGKSKSGYPIWKCSNCGKERTGEQAKSLYCRDCGCYMNLDDFIPGQTNFDI